MDSEATTAYSSQVRLCTLGLISRGFNTRRTKLARAVPEDEMKQSSLKGYMS